MAHHLCYENVIEKNPDLECGQATVLTTARAVLTSQLV